MKKFIWVCLYVWGALATFASASLLLFWFAQGVIEGPYWHSFAAVVLGVPWTTACAGVATYCADRSLD